MKPKKERGKKRNNPSRKSAKPFNAKKHIGVLNHNEDALAIQQKLRNEWDRNYELLKPSTLIYPYSAAKKLRLIEEILKIKDEAVLDELEAVIEKNAQLIKVLNQNIQTDQKLSGKYAGKLPEDIANQLQDYVTQKS